MSDRTTPSADRLAPTDLEVHTLAPRYRAERLRPFRVPAEPTRLPDGTVILERGREHRTVSSLLSGAGWSARTARRRLRRERLPSPRRWRQLARATRTALALQSAPGRPILHAALALGYADGSHPSAHLRRTFGVRPTEVQRALSYEWLLERWLRRYGRAGNPARALRKMVRV